VSRTHLVSIELEAEVMPEFDEEAATNELGVVSYTRFFFASLRLNAGGGFKLYLVYQ
jgi:hypothetical protein